MTTLDESMNDDLISRDAVLDACSQSINILDAMSRIEDLPSVTPKPCEDAISRQAVKDWFCTNYCSEHNKCEHFEKGDCNAMIELFAIQSVHAEPKTGHWIEHPEIKTSAPEYLMFYECSECGDQQCFCKPDIHRKHFCNNCGAKMVEPQESEDKE